MPPPPHYYIIIIINCGSTSSFLLGKRSPQNEPTCKANPYLVAITFDRFHFTEQRI